MSALKYDIYTHQAPWQTFALAWSNRADKPLRLAVGSFLEQYLNEVQIIQISGGSEFVSKGIIQHPHPPTKLAFHPSEATHHPDLLASAGDSLRLWDCGKSEITLVADLNNQKRSDLCAPLTSFDWSVFDTSQVVTASLDTSCTVWNVETQKAVVQLMAHDDAVFDCAFGDNSQFASVSQDKSLRLFDVNQPAKFHSLFVAQHPLLRVAWSHVDPHFLAVIAQDTNYITVLDRRSTSEPYATLRSHTSSVNEISWSSKHKLLCSGGDDKNVLVWDISNPTQPPVDPQLQYEAEAPVAAVQWSAVNEEWVGIAYSTKVQLLRVF